MVADVDGRSGLSVDGGRIWGVRAHASGRHLQISTDPHFIDRSAMSSGCIWIRRKALVLCVDENLRSRRWTARRRCCRGPTQAVGSRNRPSRGPRHRERRLATRPLDSKRARFPRLPWRAFACGSSNTRTISGLMEGIRFPFLRSWAKLWCQRLWFRPHGRARVVDYAKAGGFTTSHRLAILVPSGT